MVLERENGRLSIKNEDALASYLAAISRLPRLTRREEVALGKRIRKGDTQALRNMVEANLKFVVKVANKYKGCGIFLLDLINEGNLGLIQAATKFDPNKGVRFITYAVWWIEQAIRQAMASQCGIVRLPLNRARMLYQITKQGRELAQAQGSEPTSDALALKLGVTSIEVEDILRVSRQRFSLETPLSDGTTTNYLDMLEAENNPAIDRGLMKEALSKELDLLLSRLSAREEKIIRMRFGLNGRKEPMTLEELARDMGLSRERIRQIEYRAKMRLLRWASYKQLQSYLN